MGGNGEIFNNYQASWGLLTLTGEPQASQMKRYPAKDLRIIVNIPTTFLQQQWMGEENYLER